MKNGAPSMIPEKWEPGFGKDPAPPNNWKRFEGKKVKRLGSMRK
jgi:hypothetical protein